MTNKMKSAAAIVIGVIGIALFVHTPSVSQVTSETSRLLKKGIAQYEKENYKSAYELFRTAVKNDPFNQEASVWYWKMKAEHDVNALVDKHADNDRVARDEIKPDRKPGDQRGREVRVRRESPAGASENALALRDLQRQVRVMSEKLEDKDRQLAARTDAAVRENGLMDPFRLMVVLVIGMAVVGVGLIIFAVLYLAAGRKSLMEAQANMLPAVVRSSLAATQAGWVDAGRTSTTGVDAADRYTDPDYHSAQTEGEPGNGSRQQAYTPGHDLGDSSAHLPVSPENSISRLEVTVSGFVQLIEKRLNRGNHDNRVRRLCHDIGKSMGLTSTELAELRIAALIKDTGFLLVPEAIMMKPSGISEAERQAIRQHISHSLKITQYLMLPRRVIDAVRTHHERIDGSGYPAGLKGDDIPLYGRIIGLCDSYVALVSDRPYRSALAKETALTVLEREAALFDPEIMQLLIAVLTPADMGRRERTDYVYTAD